MEVRANLPNVHARQLVVQQAQSVALISIIKRRNPIWCKILKLIYFHALLDIFSWIEWTGALVWLADKIMKNITMTRLHAPILMCTNFSRGKILTHDLLFTKRCTVKRGTSLGNLRSLESGRIKYRNAFWCCLACPQPSRCSSLLDFVVPFVSILRVRRTLKRFGKCW